MLMQLEQAHHTSQHHCHIHNHSKECPLCYCSSKELCEEKFANHARVVLHMISTPTQRTLTVRLLVFLKTYVNVEGEEYDKILINKQM